MNRDPLVSFNTPFQSGDGLCYPIYPKNYYKTQTTPMFGGRKSKKSQKGGNKIGDYSQPSTINDYPGNAYLSNPNQRYALTGSGVPQPMNPLTEKFLNNNMGITYATQAGGRRRNSKKGGNFGPNAFNSSAGTLGSVQGENSGTLNRAQKQTGGYNVVMEEEMMKQSILSASAPMQGMYPVLSGGRKKRYNKKGGNMPTGEMSSQSNMAPAGITTQPSMQPMMQQDMQPMMQQDTQPGMQPMMQPGMQPMMQPGMQPGMQPMMQPGMQPMMSGGRYRKYSKKGGNTIFTPGANFSSQPAEIATQMDPLAQAQHIPKGGFAMKNMSGVDAQMAASGSEISSEMMGGRKKSSRTLKGGVSDFATTLSSRGPINYPDALSAQRFRYFNKTGTYIPNTQLQYAAAPVLTGYEADQNPYPMAYNDYIGGANKKKTSPKKKAAPAKKKAAPAKKKAAPAKKKAAPAKKKAT
jgi:hypothetical protein